MDTNCLNLKARFAGKILEAAVQLPASVAMVASASFHLLNLSGVLLLGWVKEETTLAKGSGNCGFWPPAPVPHEKTEARRTGDNILFKEPSKVHAYRLMRRK